MAYYRGTLTVTAAETELKPRRNYTRSCLVPSHMAGDETSCRAFRLQGVVTPIGAILAAATGVTIGDRQNSTVPS